MIGFRVAPGSLASELFSRYEKQTVALAGKKRIVFKLIDPNSISDANHEEISEELVDGCFLIKSEREME